jgi:chloramphenicol 3-O-phosphotransferase
LAACNGIYRDSYVTTFGCFVKNLGVIYAFLVEIVGVMLTIEIANRKSWNLL